MENGTQLNSLDPNTLKMLLGNLQPGGFDLWALAASFVFGVIGFYAFLNGKKEASWKRMILGILLMVYPYFVPGAWATWLVGAALCAVLYFWRD